MVNLLAAAVIKYITAHIIKPDMLPLMTPFNLFLLADKKPQNNDETTNAASEKINVLSEKAEFFIIIIENKQLNIKNKITPKNELKSNCLINFLSKAALPTELSRIKITPSYFY